MKAPHAPATVRGALQAALVAALQVVLGALVLGMVVNRFARHDRPGFALMRGVFEEHACSTSIVFMVLAVSVTCTAAFMLTHRLFESVAMWLGGRLSETLSHLLLAGLGFALATRWHGAFTLHRALVLAWFACGWLSLAGALLLEQKANFQKAGLRGRLLISLLAVAGVAGVLWGVDYAATHHMQSFLTCRTAH